MGGEPQAARVIPVSGSGSDEPFVVLIKGGRLSIPQVCSCCLSMASASFEVEASHDRRYTEGALFVKRMVETTTRSWNIPICGMCKRHVFWDNVSATIGCLSGLGAVIGAIWFIGWDNINGFTGFCIVAGLALGGLIVAAVLMGIISSLISKTGPNCAGAETPVEVKFHDFEKDPEVVEMSFKNRDYGALFCEGNEGV